MSSPVSPPMMACSPSRARQRVKHLGSSTKFRVKNLEKLGNLLTFFVLEIDKFEICTAPFLVIFKVEQIDCVEIDFKTNDRITIFVDLYTTDMRTVGQFC